MGVKTLSETDAESTLSQLKFIYSDVRDDMEDANFSRVYRNGNQSKKSVDGLEIPSIIWCLEWKWNLSKF